MPLGASRLPFLALSQTAAGPTQRTAREVVFYGNAQTFASHATGTATPRIDADSKGVDFGYGYLKLDGTGDYVQHNPGSASGDFYQLKAPFTVEVFYRPKTDTGGATASLLTIGSGNGGTAKSFGLFHRNHDMKPQLVYTPYDGSSYQNIFHYANASAVTADTWNHLVFCVNTSNYAWWLNGTRIDTGSVSDANAWIGTNGRVTIGGNDSSALPFNQGGTGLIESVRIRNEDTYGTSNASITVPTSSFTNDDSKDLLLLHFDNSNGVTKDLDDNGARKPNGLFLQGYSNQPQITNARSKWGTYSFRPGGNDTNADAGYCRSPYILPRSSDFTIEGWAYTGSTAGQVHIAAQNNNKLGFDLLASGGNLNSYFSFDGSSWGIAKVNGSHPTNSWYHWVTVRQGNTWAFGLNGTFNVYNHSYSGTLFDYGNTSSNTGNEYGIQIGGIEGTTSIFRGEMNDIRISDNARYDPTQSNYTVPTQAFDNDSNTLLLVPFDGTNYTDGGSMAWDDNGGSGR